MIKVFVAGPYSADNTIQSLKNIGRGLNTCAYLFRQGFAVFCPWWDATFILSSPSGEYTVGVFQKHSRAWLEVSDVVYVLPGSGESKGAVKDVQIAGELQIPVYTDVQELINDYSNVKY